MQSFQIKVPILNMTQNSTSKRSTEDNLCTLLWDGVIFQISINCLKMLHSTLVSTFWWHTFHCAFYDPRRTVNCTWIKTETCFKKREFSQPTLNLPSKWSKVQYQLINIVFCWRDNPYKNQTLVHTHTHTHTLVSPWNRNAHYLVFNLCMMIMQLSLWLTESIIDSWHDFGPSLS